MTQNITKGHFCLISLSTVDRLIYLFSIYHVLLTLYCLCIFGWNRNKELIHFLITFVLYRIQRMQQGCGWLCHWGVHSCQELCQLAQEVCARDSHHPSRLAGHQVHFRLRGWESGYGQIHGGQQSQNEVTECKNRTGSQQMYHLPWRSD